MITISQPVGSIPNGPKWEQVPKELLRQLPVPLAKLPVGGGAVTIQAEDWSLELQVDKEQIGPDEPGKLFARVYPGDPGARLIFRALKKKAAKLAASAGDVKILLLEKDSVAGTIERQFEQFSASLDAGSLLMGIDQIWSVNTVALEDENVIFTNQIWPPVEENGNCCRLNLETGEFWRVARWSEC